MMKNVTEIRKKILEELQLDVEEKYLKEVMKDIFDEELLERSRQRVTSMLESLLDLIISRIDEIEKPEEFEDNLKNIVKMVKG